MAAREGGHHRCRQRIQQREDRKRHRHRRCAKYQIQDSVFRKPHVRKKLSKCNSCIR
ncbi:hypothetical protein [Oryza sativa Japonica Group]|uniref:Uncharacterized protein n=1 Tax=Oryza sativa subsp. japonica TaxID=39947 RepID=Q5N851_ORYSJ|nr:hypothetical protein [Oryza sativa Japonica Group]